MRTTTASTLDHWPRSNETGSTKSRPAASTMRYCPRIIGYSWHPPPASGGCAHRRDCARGGIGRRESGARRDSRGSAPAGHTSAGLAATESSAVGVGELGGSYVQPGRSVHVCRSVGHGAVDVVPPYPVIAGDLALGVFEHLRVPSRDFGRVAELQDAARGTRGGLQGARTRLAASGVRVDRTLGVVSISGEAAREQEPVLMLWAAPCPMNGASGGRHRQAASPARVPTSRAAVGRTWPHLNTVSVPAISARTWGCQPANSRSASSRSPRADQDSSRQPSLGVHPIQFTSRPDAT